MNNEYLLRDHKFNSARPPRSKNFLLTAMLIASLGLNAYFLFYDKVGEWTSTASAALHRTEPKTQSLPTEKKRVVKPVAVKAAERPVRKEAPQARAFEVKRTAYISEDRSGDPSARFLRFKIKHSLNHSVCVLDVEKECAQLSAHIGRLLAWFLDIDSQMRKGDALETIYKKTDDPSPFKILRLTYRSQYLNKTFEANYFESPETTGYFDGRGNDVALRLKPPKAPMKDYIEITSLPGDYRKGRLRGHSGADFKAAVGTPVYSSFDGRVTRINWNFSRNGDCVEVEHPRLGIKTLYLHLNKVLVKKGQRVGAGRQIGESGNTGRSFGPHLHYEIQSLKRREKIINPFKFRHHATFTRKIPSARLEDFKKTIRLYEAVARSG